jgi:ribosomal protein S18 acetylase RimI-like enzyme
MEIRFATEQDAETIAALNEGVQRIHAEAHPHLFRPASPETFSVSYVRQLLSNPDTRMFMACEQGEPVGYLYAQVVHRPEAAHRHAWVHLQLHQMAVAEAHRRAGCGRALIQAAVGYARAQGIATVTCEVWSFNAPSRALISQLGFRPYAESFWLDARERD